MASRRGVRMVGLPKEPRSPHPRSSATMKTTFGGGVGEPCGKARAVTRARAAVRTVGPARILFVGGAEGPQGGTSARAARRALAPLDRGQVAHPLADLGQPVADVGAHGTVRPGHV